jgi:hypothetical protein
MLKIFVVFLALILMTPSFLSADGIERTTTGKIADIDWLGRKLTIRHVEHRTGRPDHITVQVPKDAELTRGSRKMSFLDIKKSDMVTVTYYSDGLGGLKVRRLANLNLGNI